MSEKYTIDNAKNDIQNLQSQNLFDFQEIKRLERELIKVNDELHLHLRIYKNKQLSDNKEFTEIKEDYNNLFTIIGNAIININMIEADINTIKGNNNINQTDITTLRTNINQLQNNLTNINSMIANLQSVDTNINSRLNQVINTAIPNINGVINNLEQIVNANSQDILDLNNRVTNLENNQDNTIATNLLTTVGNIRDRLNVAENDITNNKNKITDILTDINTLQNELNSFDTRLIAVEGIVLGNLTTRLHLYEVNLQRFDEELDQAQTDIEILYHLIEQGGVGGGTGTGTGVTPELLQRLNNIEQSIVDTNIRIDNLQLTNIEQEVQAIRNTVTTLQEQTNNLANDVEELADKVLNMDLSIMEDRITANENNITDLNTRVFTLESDNVQNKQDIVDINDRLDNLDVSDMTGYAKTFTTLADLELTPDVNIDDVIDKLKDGETAILNTDEFTNYLTMFPNQCDSDKYGILKIQKSNNTVYVIWLQKQAHAYAIGGINDNNKFTNWNNIVRIKSDGFGDDNIISIGNTVNTDGSIQTLDSLGFSKDIMTWETGIYKVSDVSWLTNLPSDISTVAPSSFRLEHHNIQKWTDGGNPSNTTEAQRHSIYYAEGGNIYHRYTESGNTPNVFIKDTGWTKVCTDDSRITELENKVTKTYTTLLSLGLSTPVTIGEIFNAMSDNSMAIIGCEDMSDYITDVPISFGVLTIEKKNNGRFSIEYQNSFNGNVAPVKRWIGTLKGSDGTGLIWKLLVDESSITALETQINDLFQSVSNGKTLVANAITDKGINTPIDSTFVTMANNIGKISGGYKEETKTLIITSNTTGIEVLPFTFSSNVIAVKQIIAPSHEDYSVVTSTSKNIFNINNNVLTLNAKGTGKWQVTAIINNS